MNKVIIEVTTEDIKLGILRNGKMSKYSQKWPVGMNWGNDEEIEFYIKDTIKQVVTALKELG